jgi:hemolysin type calcium-binding protein
MFRIFRVVAVIGALCIVGPVELVLYAVVSYAGQDNHRHEHCLGRRATIVGPNTRFHGPGHRRVIVGSRHRDVIVGTKRPEWIVGAGKGDTVCAGGGSDYVFVGDAQRKVDRPTRIDGGAGGDYIAGSFASDRIEGGSGDDVIDAEFGSDRIRGGRGDDFVRGQVGADRIELGRGDDHVEASSGNDLVLGGRGDDHIATGPGSDRVLGGPGNDEIRLLWARDVGRGGPGNDLLGGGLGEDFCNGGSGRDLTTSCEHKRETEGHLPRRLGHSHDGHHHHHGLTHFQRTAPMLHLIRFLHRLERTQMVRSDAVTRRLMDRKSTLGRKVENLIDHRYAARRRHHTKRKRAVFRKSVEAHELKMVMTHICNQIDRLRFTPPR